MAEPGASESAAPGSDEERKIQADRLRATVAKALEADESPRMYRIAKLLRDFLPGDRELGDPLSTAGDRPSHLLARRVAESASERPSVARELGLGALQVWQALSEAQGRGRGDREVAILFTDLVDFSSWALGAGDEATLELLRKVGVAEETCIRAHGGEVVKRIGDGLMAVFDDPRAAAQAAHEAVAKVAALEMQGYRPKLRAGLHVGRPRKLGGDFIGVDVNIAARIAAAAEGGEILASGQACERLGDDSFSKRRRRRFRAKGAPSDLEVYSVSPVLTAS
jgi:adenylate cyclase